MTLNEQLPLGHGLEVNAVRVKAEGGIRDLVALTINEKLGGPSGQNSDERAAFACPPEDIIRTKCLGPKDCLYPNPDDCDSFIQCTVNPGGVTGTPVVMPCPAGLHWNDRGKICDYPANADCQE